MLVILGAKQTSGNETRTKTAHAIRGNLHQCVFTDYKKRSAEIILRIRFSKNGNMRENTLPHRRKFSRTTQTAPALVSLPLVCFAPYLP